MREHQPCFRTVQKNPSVFARLHFRFKMDDTMKKTQQDKMALKFLIVDVNMQIDQGFPGGSANIIGVLF